MFLLIATFVLVPIILSIAMYGFVKLLNWLDTNTENV